MEWIPRVLSGFVYHVLSRCGIKDVPRDAREQYVWVRKAGTFEAVLAQRDDSFELDALKPGDLLFWATPYSVSREPDVIQTMIYIGRDKATNQRLMVGASEGRTYKGQMRKGVGAFDFKIGRTASKASKEALAEEALAGGSCARFSQKCFASAAVTSAATIIMTRRCSRFVRSKIFFISPFARSYGPDWSRAYLIGSGKPASRKPFRRSLQESHSPQARPSGSGS